MQQQNLHAESLQAAGWLNWCQKANKMLDVLCSPKFNVWRNCGAKVDNGFTISDFPGTKDASSEA